jgi:outer membrane lipoprotein-sorting protein
MTRPLVGLGRGTNPWRSLIPALIVATTGACISGGKYPKGWTEPVPVVNDDCPDVSGVYSNLGEVQPGGGDASLNLFLRPGIPLLAATQVEIARSDRFLEISLWSDGNVSEKRRLERGVGFECGPKGLQLLELGYSASSAAVNVGAEFSWGKVWMTKGGDGSLVVRTVDSDLFILILVPLYARQALWYRFPAAEGAGPRQDREAVLPVANPAIGEATGRASLDEVMTKIIESSGGGDAWKAVESARITGRMVRLHDWKAGPFSLELKRPNKWRREVGRKGGMEITAFDGETGWMLRPKRTEPWPMTPLAVSLIGFEVPFFGPLLLDSSTEGDNIELLGEENVGGTTACKIKVTRQSGDVDHIYVDAERFLVFRLDRRTQNPAIVERQTFVGNYKRVGALMFPHTLEVRETDMTTLSTMTIDRVELNPGIGDDRFAMPRVSR